MSEAVVGQLYLHYKKASGESRYTVLHVALDCEDPARELVVYQNEASKKIWVRERSSFEETVVDKGELVQRFQLLVESPPGLEAHGNPWD